MSLQISRAMAQLPSSPGLGGLCFVCQPLTRAGLPMFLALRSLQACPSNSRVECRGEFLPGGPFPSILCVEAACGFPTREGTAVPHSALGGAVQAGAAGRPACLALGWVSSLLDHINATSESCSYQVTRGWKWVINLVLPWCVGCSHSYGQ